MFCYCRRKKKCIRALGLDENEVGASDSEDGGNLSSLGHLTDGESLPGGSPLASSLDHHAESSSAAAAAAASALPSRMIPSLYGSSPVLPKSPLARPLLSPLIPPPSTPPSVSSAVGLHSPHSAAARQLSLPQSSSHLHSPSLLHHSPSRRLHPPPPQTTSSPAAASGSAASMLLAT